MTFLRQCGLKNLKNKHFNSANLFLELESMKNSTRLLKEQIRIEFSIFVGLTFISIWRLTNATFSYHTFCDNLSIYDKYRITRRDTSRQLRTMCHAMSSWNSIYIQQQRECITPNKIDWIWFIFYFIYARKRVIKINFATIVLFCLVILHCII